MTTPIHGMGRGVSVSPWVAEITRLVDDDHHLVLRIDTAPGGEVFNEQSVGGRLDPNRPDHGVFDGGGLATLKIVIAKATVLTEADASVAAAIRFRRVATDLMGRPSRKLAIPLVTFYRLERRPAPRPPREGAGVFLPSSRRIRGVHHVLEGADRIAPIVLIAVPVFPMGRRPRAGGRQSLFARRAKQEGVKPWHGPSGRVTIGW